MIYLDNVTLITVSSVRIDETIYACLKSMERIKFKAVKLISHERPTNLPEGIDYEPCERITNAKEYSYYCIYNLFKHVATLHCLLIQWDGYVINPEKWDDKFLDYDYIGAVWPYGNALLEDKFGSYHRVGNGGFSLRSKKMLNVPSKIKIPFDAAVNERAGSNIPEYYYNEDTNICCHSRHLYERQGCVFAPLSVAVRFSHELWIPENEGIIPFGFHRKLPRQGR